MSVLSTQSPRMVPRVVRFNREYFGYIVGFDDGQIALYHNAAGAALQQAAAAAELEPYALEVFEVRPGFHLASPLLVWLELTRRCNLTCPHCYIDAGDPRQSELPTAEVRRLLDEMAEMGVWAVTFTGGEPTMHADFVDLVHHARDAGLLVGIATNGSFLSETLLEQLPRDGVIVSVSFDNLHVRNPRDAASDFRLASRAVLRSRRQGFTTNVMTNTHKLNLDVLDDLLDWAKANYVSVRSIPFSPVGRGKQHRDLENTPEDVPRLASFWLKEKEWEAAFHHDVGLCVGNIFDYGETLGFMTRRCPSGRYLCYIASDGTVFPCTSCAAEGILSPGSVRSTPLPELWASEWDIRRYSWDDFRGVCEGCPIDNADYYCASRCPASSHARHGQYIGCGASEFQIQSTIVRTTMLRRSTLSEG